MDIIEDIVGGMLVLGLALFPLFIIYNVIIMLWGKFFGPVPSLFSSKKQFDGKTFSKIGTDTIENILTSRFAYYQKLSPDDKTKFIKRTIRFIDQKHFRAMENLELTEEMIVLISASAIQLTFGLTNYLFDHFDKIFIYPREFYSRRSKEYHRGETNLGGVVVLSWKHFSEGYSNTNDNLNLGLHEMAHVLRFDQYKSDSYDNFFAEYINKWQLISQEEFKKISNKESSYFREYAGTNFSEFFSVCIECFFESPRDFKSRQPEIYKHLCILLNQDPVNNSVNLNSRNAILPDRSADRGKPVVAFENKKHNLSKGLWGIFFSLVMMIVFLLYSGVSWKNDYFFILAFIGIYVFSTIRKIFTSKKKIIVYENGIRIESPFSTKLNYFFFYEDLSSVSIMQGNEEDEEKSIQINAITHGKIKKITISFAFPDDFEMKKIRDLLIAKKIPVKFEGYEPV